MITPEDTAGMSFAQIKEVFKKFDQDGSGMIDASELQMVLVS